MKYLEARHLRLSQVKAVDIPALFNQNNIPYNSIDVINWHAFPYCPKVEFAIAHTGDTILLHYRVEEDGVRAVAGEDLGHVWEDSCCEFFASPDADGSYYNLESNCIGTILLCNGKGREERMQAPLSALKKIDRWASLGRKVTRVRDKKRLEKVGNLVKNSYLYR
ncbi:carbohydrate-binding family 9-like protein [Prevotella histicola]